MNTLFAAALAIELRAEHDGLGRVTASGPKVSGRSAPIFTPVQPSSLCKAVTMATHGTSRTNCAR